MNQADLLRELRDGGPGVLAVLGDPGQGKSRLLDYLLLHWPAEVLACDIEGAMRFPDERTTAGARIYYWPRPNWPKFRPDGQPNPLPSWRQLAPGGLVVVDELDKVCCGAPIWLRWALDALNQVRSRSRWLAWSVRRPQARFGIPRDATACARYFVWFRQHEQVALDYAATLLPDANVLRTLPPRSFVFLRLW